MLENDPWALFQLAESHGADEAQLVSAVFNNLPYFPWGLNEPGVDEIKESRGFTSSRTIDGTIVVSDLGYLYGFLYDYKDYFLKGFIDENSISRLESAKRNSGKRLKSYLEKHNPDSFTFGIYNTKVNYTCAPDLPLALQCTHWDLTALIREMGYSYATPDESDFMESLDAHRDYEWFFSKFCYTAGKNQCLATTIVKDC